MLKVSSSPLPFTNLSTPPTLLQLPIQEELLLLTVAFDLLLTVACFSSKHDSRQIKYFFLFNFTGVVLFCFGEMFFVYLVDWLLLLDCHQM